MVFVLRLRATSPEMLGVASCCVRVGVFFFLRSGHATVVIVFVQVPEFGQGRAGFCRAAFGPEACVACRLCAVELVEVYVRALGLAT